MPQGEDRDSSDEEWDAAYAALDPREQMGWGNRRSEPTAVGANLVRDVLAAADELHENAMSEMDANTVVDEEIRLDGAGDAAGEASMSWCREASADPVDNMDPPFGGESLSHSLVCG